MHNPVDIFFRTGKIPLFGIRKVGKIPTFFSGLKYRKIGKIPTFESKNLLLLLLINILNLTIYLIINVNVNYSSSFFSGIFPGCCCFSLLSLNTFPNHNLLFSPARRSCSQERTAEIPAHMRPQAAVSKGATRRKKARVIRSRSRAFFAPSTGALIPTSTR